MIEKRMEMLCCFERAPRQYNKSANDYWSTEIKETRAKRPRLCSKALVDDETNIRDCSRITPEMIKARLKELGIITRVRNVKRLQEMYQNVPKY